MTFHLWELLSYLTLLAEGREEIIPEADFLIDPEH